MGSLSYAPTPEIGGVATEAIPGTVAPAAETGGTTGTTLGSIATPAAIVAGAELAKNLWGGNGIGWDEKTTQQKVVDRPVISGTLAQFAPGALFAKEGTVVSDLTREAARINSQIMKPIDWLFGDK